MYALDASIVNIALPSLLKQFSCSLKEIQWVMISYLAASVALLLPVAKMANRHGRKRIFLAGLTIFLLGSLLCGISWNLPSIVVFRVVQGLGAACLAALMSSVITGIFPDNELGRALGLVTTFATLGTSLGPSIGGYLISLAGWPWIFLVNLPVGVLALSLVTVFVPNDKKPPSEPASIAPPSPRPQMLPLLANPDLLIALSARFFSMALNAAFLFLAPFLLQKSLHFSIEKSGIFLAATPVFIGIAAPVIGFLCDKFGTRNFNLAGLLCLFLSSFSLASFHEGMSDSSYLAKLLLFGAGMAFLNAPNNKIIMGTLTPQNHSSASAFLSFSIMLGQMAGVWGAGALFRQIAESRFGNADMSKLLPAQIAASSGGVFLFFAPFLLLPLLATLFRPPPPPLPNNH